MKQAPLLDRLYVAMRGGVRIRVGPEGVTAVGRVQGPPPRQLVSIVQDLVRDEQGVVHLWRDQRGHWGIKTRGPFASPSLEQRLRNVLGNL